MSDTPIMISPASAAAAWPRVEKRLAERFAAHAEQERGAYAESTERGRQADRRVFAKWCAARGVSPLPATAEVIAAFLDDCAARGHKIATLERRLSSIGHMHKAAGLDGAANPARSEVVRLALRRIARSLGRQQKRAAPIGQREAGQILAAVGPAPGLQRLRDVGLLLVTQDGLLRRSEAVALDIADLDLGDESGGTIIVRRSKTDAGAVGCTLYIGPRTCFWLKRWIEQAEIGGGGALFRSLGKTGRVLGRRLHVGDVNRALKRLATLAGLDPAIVSGHSARRGTCQDLVGAGASLGEVMAAGRWKDPSMVMVYASGQLAKRGAVARLLHGQAA